MIESKMIKNLQANKVIEADDRKFVTGGELERIKDMASSTMTFSQLVQKIAELEAEIQLLKGQ